MRSAVLVGCALLVTIGCSSPSPTPTPDPTPAPAPLPAPAPSPPGGRTLGSAEGRTPGVRAEVTELRRTSGGTLTLRFTLVNDSNQAINVADVQELLDLGTSYPVGGVHLIDPVGRKKYFVARDSNNKCVCSEFQAVRAGQRANHWAKFPAPPEDVQQISVVLPTFAPLDDVAISR